MTCKRHTTWNYKETLSDTLKKPKVELSRNPKETLKKPYIKPEKPLTIPPRNPNETLKETWNKL